MLTYANNYILMSYKSKYVHFQLVQSRATRLRLTQTPV